MTTTISTGLTEMHVGTPPARLVRRLIESDVECLLELEQTKWTEDQAADVSHLTERIRTRPEMSIGAFDVHTGEALASLFVTPISTVQLQRAQTWSDCTDSSSMADNAPDDRNLFGISLSSRDADAVDDMFTYFGTWALAQGSWDHVYLGSPIPGLREWSDKNPDGRVEDYVRASRNSRPLDPQLRLYYAKGFTEIVACKRDYFPHEASLDYGVVIRGRLGVITSGAVARVAARAGAAFDSLADGKP